MVSPVTLGVASQKTVDGIALGPASTTGMQAIILGVPQGLCSQSHQRRSTGAHPLKSGSGTTGVTSETKRHGSPNTA